MIWYYIKFKKKSLYSSFIDTVLTGFKATLQRKSINLMSLRLCPNDSTFNSMDCNPKRTFSCLSMGADQFQMIFSVKVQTNSQRTKK